MGIVEPWFIATKPFGPIDGENWKKFVEWSGLLQLEELVSLDGILCPTVLGKIKPEYWPHIVNEDFMLNYFTDLPFLLDQVRNVAEKNLLCVFRDPDRRPDSPPDGTFEFLGYDLVDRLGDVSALTNCGGFPKAFSNSELSKVGLLTELERAIEVQVRLRSLYPRQSHTECHVWAIFRMRRPSD